MKEGLLWYDNQGDLDLEKRITSAVKFFESKYGYFPNKCFVNPDTLDERLELDRKIKILPSDRVMINHIWLEFSSN
jgi:hypothetical protein